MTYIGYTSAPFIFDVPITVEAGAGISDFTGGTVSVDARDEKTGLKVHGEATISGPLLVQCRFDAGTLPVGNHSVQVLLGRPGSDEAQVVVAFLLRMYPGAV